MSQQSAVRSSEAPANVVNGVDLGILSGTVAAITEAPALGQCHFRVTNTWLGGSKNRSTVTGFYGAGQENSHQQAYVLDADEPPVLAGSDEAPNPVEHLLNALAACITTSIVAHAAVRGIAIEELECHVEGDLDLRGFLGIDAHVAKGFTDIRVDYKVKADVDDLEKLQRLAVYSPVFQTVTQGTNVHINIERK